MIFIDKKIFKKIDYTLLVTALIIIFYSLLIISSAGHIGVGDGSSLTYTERQVIFVILGLIVMAFFMFFEYEKLSRLMWPIYFINIVSLALVIVLGFTALGAQRWIPVGPFQYQPSEFAKVLIIISFAGYLVSRQGRLNKFWDMIPCFIFIGVPLLMILKQPDLGTSLVFIAIMFGMMYVAGANPKVLGVILLIGLLLVCGWMLAHYHWGVWIPLEEYQFKRLVAFIDPWSDLEGSGYQVIQSQIAVGSGGFWGKGLYQGTQSQLNFLPGPEQHTDFIFSVVGEEIGFKGAFLLLILYFIFIYRALVIAREAKDKFGLLLSIGIICMFAFQITINTGMTMGIMPVTGLPLPLFSYGGSSMLANMAAIGLLLNVYMRRQKIIF